MKTGNIESKNIQNVNEIVFDSGELASLDSYTKLLIHGDSDSDSVGKTVTVSETYDTYTKLMLHLDNNVTDAATAKTVTNNNVTFSSSVYKMGTHSAVFNGSSAYLSIPDHADFSYGSGDWTIDFWAKFSTDQLCNLYQQWTAPYGAFGIIYSSNSITIYSSEPSVGTVEFQYLFDWTYNTNWNHFAFVRSGNNLYCFVNGVSQTLTEYTSISGKTLTDQTSALYIGYSAKDSGRYFSGYLDEYRVNKGIARWTANFTPPSNPYGTTAVTKTQYKFPILSRSLEFDGSGDYMSLADSADWYFGTGDFTIDFWVKFNSIASTCCFVGQYASSASYWECYWSSTNVGGFHFIDGSVTKGQYFFTWTPTVGTWYHLVFERTTTTAKIFINGVSQTLTENVAFSTNDVGNVAANLEVGRLNLSTPSEYFHGWLSEVRISKGIARWTSNFDVPTDIYGGPVSFLCATGLDGDTDEQYQIISRQIGGPINQDYIRFSINEDNVANPGVYGLQRLYASNNTAGAIRGTGNSYGLINYTASANATSLGEYTFYAKSGNARTWTGSFTGQFENTNNETEHQGNVWNNTVDNVVSFQGFGVVDNHIGAGSRFIVVRNAHASLLRTGTMDVVGKVKYAWQEIYNYEVGEAEDSYTKLLIHGDSNTKGPYGCLDSTGKTITTPEVNDSYTKLMLHFNGTDGSTTFTDSSLTGRTITAYGTAQLDTEKHKFQTASGLFNRSNSDYLTAPDHADWTFGTGDFTIECWVRPTSITHTTYNGICGQFVDTNNWWRFLIVDDSITFGCAFGGISNEKNCQSISGVIAPNIWQHIAAVRSSGVTKIYVNGTNVTDYDTIASTNLTDLAADLKIGECYNGICYFDGWIDELRISKGIARWTSDFTPKDIPYGAVGSTNQEYKFSQIGRSFEFGNGGLTYATVADSADWVFGTDPHTIDFWVRWDSITSSQISNIWMQYATGGSGGWVDLAVGNNAGSGYCHWGYWHADESGRFSMSITSGTTSAFVADRWYHIAVVRIDTSDASTSWRIYIDGVAQTIERGTGGSYVSWGSANFFNLASVGTIGVDSADLASNPHYGQIADLRISNGVARWTSNFTPPTSPHGGPVSNVSIPISGNTDVLYKIKVKTVAGSTTHGIRLNNNSSTDYRGEYLLGINTTTSASRSLDQVYIPLNYNNLDVGDVNYSEGLLYTNSGYNRTYLGKAEMKITLDDSTYADELEWTSKVGELQLQGNEWVNSIDEVKDIGIISISNNALGPGSHIIIEKLNL